MISYVVNFCQGVWLVQDWTSGVLLKEYVRRKLPIFNPPPSFSFVQFPFVRTTNNLDMKIKGDCSADEHVPSAKNSDFSLCTLYLYILKAIRTILWTTQNFLTTKATFWSLHVMLTRCLHDFSCKQDILILFYVNKKFWYFFM